MNDEKKHADVIAHEAKRTAAAGALFAAAWVFLGFGLAGDDADIAGFPLWTLTSSVGVLIMGTMLAVSLACAAKDVPFDAEKEETR